MKGKSVAVMKIIIKFTFLKLYENLKGLNP